MKLKTSPYEIELFSTFSHWAIFIGICLVVFMINIYIEYNHFISFSTPSIQNKDTLIYQANSFKLKEFKEIKTTTPKQIQKAFLIKNAARNAQIYNQKIITPLQDKPQEIIGKVIAHYTKQNASNKTYNVLKIQDENGATFFTTSYEDIKNLSNRYVRIYGKKADRDGFSCDYIQYLKSCFFNTFAISVLSKRDFRDDIRHFINSQHTDPKVAQLYRALFIADFIDKDMREISNVFGVAHVIAISGFHLGILTLFLTLIFTPLYRLAHKKFSYRNELYDIGAMVLISMFGYLLLLDFAPSFLRAFVAAAFVFAMLFFGLRLLSFRLLFVVGIFCVALFPRLMFNVGFFLSIFGIFYIYLFLKHFFNVDSINLSMLKSPKILFKTLCMILLFNTIIFLNMLVLAHFFFPIFSPLNTLSILASIVFVIFFPLVLLLHIFGFGDLFDGFFVYIFNLNLPYVEVYTPLFVFIGFLILSFCSIFSKKIYLGLVALSVIFYGFMCARYFGL